MIGYVPSWLTPPATKVRPSDDNFARGRCDRRRLEVHPALLPWIRALRQDDLTNTVTSKDVELLRSRGARSSTATPKPSGRSFGTNVIEPSSYPGGARKMTLRSLDVLRELGWDRPRVEHLNG